MKSCSCNGMNENCRNCFGLGYVPDDQPLPRERIVSPVFHGTSEAAPSPPRAPIPVDPEWERKRRRIARKNLLIGLAPYIVVLLTLLAMRWFHGC